MEDKVRVPASVSAVIGAVFIVLAAFDFELPAGLNEQVANEAAAAIVLLVALVQAVIGYATNETNPAPSAKATLAEQGWRRPDRRA